MNLHEIREKAIDSELLTITSGSISAKTSTYTQNSTSNHGNLECVINAYYFEHNTHGGILIDGGFSSDFYHTPLYGNLNFIMKLFLKLNGGKYIQAKKTDTACQLKVLGAKPDHVSVTYGKGEKDARESADKIRAFSRLYPEVEVYYSHDI